MRPRNLNSLATTTLAVLAGSLLLAAGSARAQFTLQGPGVNADDFRVTTFASGLNFPVGMTELDDGSILVATSNGNSFFGSSSGSLIRLADTDNDGVADVTQTLVNDVPGGKLTSVRRSGDLIFTTGQGSPVPISVYRAGAQPSDSLTFEGSFSINYTTSWLHPHSALAARPTPGVPNSHDLFFQLGSKTNFDDTTQTLNFTSTLGASTRLNGDAIHMVRITDTDGTLSSAAPVQIATGLRNAAGMAFHPVTGDLYLEDNGIDGVEVAIEPTSADELNRIPAADIGGAIEDFGFPTTYVEYRTDVQVGNTGIDPLVAFQPIPTPDGAEGEGPNDIAFAPANFPEALNNGVFVGMHGQFSSGGLANEENPLVFADLNDNSYFHFIGNDEPGVGHLDGLLSTTDSLFAADLSPAGSLGSSSSNEGKIYQIKSLVAPISPDLNMDGFVDGLDLGILLGNFNQTTAPGGGELNGTDPVDGLDLGILLGAWNPPSPLTTTVPEPTSWALLTLTGVAVSCLRRTQRLA